MTEYKPYTRCPKCGHYGVGTQYVASELVMEDAPRKRGRPKKTPKLVEKECLKRECAQCGYAWKEACRDTITT